MGRHKLPEEAAHGKSLMLRLTPAEKEALRNKSEEMGITMGEYIRRLLEKEGSKYAES